MLFVYLSFVVCSCYPKTPTGCFFVSSSVFSTIGVIFFVLSQQSSITMPKETVRTEQENDTQEEPRVVVHDMNNDDDDSDQNDHSFHETCVICLSEPIDDPSMLLPCYHSFCYPCIVQWLSVHDTCPLCKARPTSIIHNIRSSSAYDQTPLTPAASATTTFNSNLSNTTTGTGTVSVIAPTVGSSRSHRGENDDENSGDEDASEQEEDQYFASTHYNDNDEENEREELLKLEMASVEQSRKQRRALVYQQRLECVVDEDRVHKLIKTKQYSVAYYRKMESIIGPRVREWINRELNIIRELSLPVEINCQMIADLVMSLMSRVDIVHQQDLFVSQLQNLFIYESDAQIFVQELALFVQSDLSMKQYDNICQYRVIP